jgi:hypothetical protein
MSNVIYHDFTKPEMHIEVTFEDDDPNIFNMDYEIVPCLFGYEAVIKADWREKPYYLPEFFRTETIAAAEAEAHRLEELSKVEKLFDDIIIDMTEDDDDG